MHKQKIIIKTTPSYKKSQGAILVVSLILLLVMTLVGISAIDTSSLQSQMARNSLFAQSLYQASRSEIEAQYEKLKGLPYLESVMISNTAESDGNPTITMADSQVETYNANDPYQQTAAVTFTGDSTPPSGYSLGLFVGKNFEVDALSQVAGTGSKSDQTQGLNYPAPL